MQLEPTSGSGRHSRWPDSRFLGGWLFLMLVACGQEDAPSSEASAGSAAALAVQVVAEVPSGPSPADQRATIDARYALAGDPGVDLRQFRVRVEAGVATVESSTADEAARERARSLVAAVGGVREVRLVGVVPAEAADGSGDAAVAVTDVELEEGSGFPPADSLVQLGDPASQIAAPPLPVVLEGSATATADTGSAPAATAAATAAGEPAAAEATNDREYTVQPGDNLSGIAEREMGDRGAWRRLYEHNRSVIGSSPERLRDGMVLRIPGARQ